MRKTDIINSLSQLNLLVVGDFILDQYYFGKVTRISPEAPIPIVDLKSSEYRLGGAGNTVANLLGLGCSVTACGIIGDDYYGKLLLDLLKRKNITSILCKEVNSKTSVKTRVLSEKQQLIRIDNEDVKSIDEKTIQYFLTNINESLDSYDGVILSDYNKGVLVDKFSLEVIKLARNMNIPVIVDPKGKNYNRYYNANIITPNYYEFELVVEHDDITIDNIGYYGKSLCNKLDLDCIVVTLGPKGAYIVNRDGKSRHRPTKKIDVYDVSGAGDTFIAVFFSFFLVLNDPILACEIANLASSIVIGKIGTIPIRKGELLESMEDNI